MKIKDNHKAEEIEDFVDSLMTIESCLPKREESKQRIFSPR